MNAEEIVRTAVEDADAAGEVMPGEGGGGRSIAHQADHFGTVGEQEFDHGGPEEIGAAGDQHAPPAPI